MVNVHVVLNTQLCMPRCQFGSSSQIGLPAGPSPPPRGEGPAPAGAPSVALGARPWAVSAEGSLGQLTIRTLIANAVRRNTSLEASPGFLRKAAVGGGGAFPMERAGERVGGLAKKIG